MQHAIDEQAATPFGREIVPASEANCSAVSWAAIFAGVFVAASVSVILALLGSGLGFAAAAIDTEVNGEHTKAISMMYVVWLILIQWAASGMGGYLTGRLRKRWASIHTHEVFFRDTAHGLLMWAVATILTIALFMSVTASFIRTGASMAAPALYGMADDMGDRHQENASDGSNPLAYDVDMLLRTANPATPPAPTTVSDSDQRAEISRILVKGLTDDSITDADRNYLVQLVTARTGLAQPDAEKRVNDLLTQEKAMKTKVIESAETARKMAASLAIFTALSMLIGAFIASVSAALGGRVRDLT